MEIQNDLAQFFKKIKKIWIRFSEGKGRPLMFILLLLGGGVRGIIDREPY